MNDITREYKKDITVWIDREGITLTVTFECEYVITTEPRSEMWPKQVTLEWIDYRPIHASLLDRDDEEITWHYGDNMPGIINDMIDRYADVLAGKLEQEALDNQ